MKRLRGSKLRLARESIRHLQGPEMARAAGGAVTDPEPWTTYCPGPTDVSYCKTGCTLRECSVGCATRFLCPPQPGTLVDCPFG